MSINYWLKYSSSISMATEPGDWTAGENGSVFQDPSMDLPTVPRLPSGEKPVTESDLKKLPATERNWTSIQV